MSLCRRSLKLIGLVAKRGCLGLGAGESTQAQMLLGSSGTSLQDDEVILSGSDFAVFWLLRSSHRRIISHEFILLVELGQLGSQLGRMSGDSLLPAFLCGGRSW